MRRAILWALVPLFLVGFVLLGTSLYLASDRPALGFFLASVAGLPIGIAVAEFQYWKNKGEL